MANGLLNKHPHHTTTKHFVRVLCTHDRCTALDGDTVSTVVTQLSQKKASFMSQSLGDLSKVHNAKWQLSLLFVCYVMAVSCSSSSLCSIWQANRRQWCQRGGGEIGNHSVLFVRAMKGKGYRPGTACTQAIAFWVDELTRPFVDMLKNYFIGQNK